MVFNCFLLGGCDAGGRTQQLPAGAQGASAIGSVVDWLRYLELRMSQRTSYSVHELWLLGVYWDTLRALEDLGSAGVAEAGPLPRWLGAGAYLTKEGLYFTCYYTSIEGASKIGLATDAGSEIAWQTALGRGTKGRGVYMDACFVRMDSQLVEAIGNEARGHLVCYLRLEGGATSLDLIVGIVDGRDSTGGNHEKLMRTLKLQSE